MHGIEASDYLDAIRDWAANGDRSVFAMSEKELKERLAPQNPDWAQAAVAEYLYRNGQSAASIRSNSRPRSMQQFQRTAVARIGSGYGQHYPFAPEWERAWSS
jgi:hypothetical protein